MHCVCTFDAQVIVTTLFQLYSFMNVDYDEKMNMNAGS